MLQQITKGIKISVNVKFEGSFLKEMSLNHAFIYYITIENQSKDVVQLISRHWKIFESINRTQYLNGDGVVGKKTSSKARRYSYLQIWMFNHISYGIYVRNLYYGKLF